MKRIVGDGAHRRVFVQSCPFFFPFLSFIQNTTYLFSNCFIVICIHVCTWLKSLAIIFFPLRGNSKIPSKKQKTSTKSDETKRAVISFEIANRSIRSYRAISIRSSTNRRSNARSRKILIRSSDRPILPFRSTIKKKKN